MRQACSGKKVQGMPGQPFAIAEEIVCMTHGSPQPSQHRPGREIEFTREDLWRIFLSSGISSYEIHRRPTKFLRT